MPDRYLIPGELFASLSRGQGGSPAGRWLVAAERSKHLLLLRGIVDGAAAAAHPDAAAIRRDYEAMADIHRHSGTAVEAVLRQPAVSAWAAQANHDVRQGNASVLVSRQMSAIAAATAIRAHAAYHGAVPVTSGAVMLPSVGRALLPGCRIDATAEIRVSPARTDIAAQGARLRLPADLRRDGDGWQALRQVSVAAAGRQLTVMIDDIDPWRFAGFPGVAGRLAAAELSQWESRIRSAFRLLVARHPRVADELAAMTTVLTPLLAGPRGAAHATSRDAFGCIALSAPRDGRALALALAHEIQHAKLAGLLDVVTLISPARNEGTYYAPWRDDPRPLPALLHGAYAFLGVTEFWGREREHSSAHLSLVAHTEFARWLTATVESASVIAESKDLTTLGRRFVSGMRSRLRQWEGQPIPAEAAELARIAAESHRKRWQQ